MIGFRQTLVRAFLNQARQRSSGAIHLATPKVAVDNQDLDASDNEVVGNVLAKRRNAQTTTDPKKQPHLYIAQVVKRYHNILKLAQSATSRLRIDELHLLYHDALPMAFNNPAIARAFQPLTSALIFPPTLHGEMVLKYVSLHGKIKYMIEFSNVYLLPRPEQRS
jgi:hypothetical protein